MARDLEISLDKLPVNRLESIEENGFERFPSDFDYDVKRMDSIRRIDFAWAVQREDPSKKKKTEGSSAKEGVKTVQQQWQWQSLVENLQLAHQELSVIIDIINTVEANDAVTVAGMTRPKQLPSEHLSDLAVSMATKLQCFRSIGKYFKQSAKVLEEKVAREARFYGALIRLQQNWKIKRHRLVAAASGNEGFYIDLFDNSLYDLAAVVRPSSMATVPLEHNTAGMLTVNLQRESLRTLQFEFLGLKKYGENKTRSMSEDSSEESEKEQASDDERVREINSTLREVHRTIHDEQVFDLVSREAFNLPLHVNLAGIKENYLQLSIGQGASVFLSLASLGQEDQTHNASNRNTSENSDTSFLSSDRAQFGEVIDKSKKFGAPNQLAFDIFLRQLIHENMIVKTKSRAMSTSRSQMPGQPLKENTNILGHFCMSLAHRIFSNKVLSLLENLVYQTPYVQLISHSTWHSRTSSWILSMKIPQSILHAGVDNVPKFWTKVVVIDDSIKVEGEGSPNVLYLFKGNSDSARSINEYECNLTDLSLILLQQIASQIIQWLHEEALAVGIKANKDFLSLGFKADRGEIFRLVVHIDPDDTQGCISWWLTIDDERPEDHQVGSEMKSESRKFLGYLPLDLLYSTLLDIFNLCSCL